MKRFTIVTAIAIVLIISATVAFAKVDPDSPQESKITFVEVGWMDITATTAATTVVLEALGYDTMQYLVSVPIAYASLKYNEADVFLGNWMPSMKSIVEPYLKSGDVEVVRTNLTGAKYTLAVPSYVAKQGVRSFKDIARFSDRFDGRIYGIEAGNDGNLLIEKMIKDNAFGLGKMILIDSSEPAMLLEVKSMVRENKWIVFLAWEPHPMNVNFDITYLDGGDDYFGPDYGAAVVRTNVRKNFKQDQPNVYKLLENLEFSLKMENEIMSKMDKGTDERKAAVDWIKKNPEILNKWLDGVKTISGKDGLAAVKKAFSM